eukprot:PhF_6_TR19596/c0_g1_i1/m.28590
MRSNFLRRTLPLLAGGEIPHPHLKEYHEWHLHEPLLINYEGWRILDNVPMTYSEAYFWDFGGYGRHLDPIIDDPRLSHSQRVCRLYRWSLKELKSYLSRANWKKFNLGMKVVRARFEKYRHVRDPAMCDMMVRETQKYLRETCSIHYMRVDARSRNSTAWWQSIMVHPDNIQVYDHWVPYQVQVYDDAKMHRYQGHNPAFGELEVWDRWGEQTHPEWWNTPFLWGFAIMELFLLGKMIGVFWDPNLDQDKAYKDWLATMDTDLQQWIDYEERIQRSKYSSASLINFDWDRVVGNITTTKGFFWQGGRYTNPGEGFGARASDSIVGLVPERPEDLKFQQNNKGKSN